MAKLRYGGVWACEGHGSVCYGCEYQRGILSTQHPDLEKEINVNGECFPWQHAKLIPQENQHQISCAEKL